MNPNELLNVSSPMMSKANSYQEEVTRVSGRFNDTNLGYMICTYLCPLAHIDRTALQSLHLRQESVDSRIDMRLKVLQSIHSISTTDKPALLRVDLLITFGEQVEFSVPLPDRVPSRFTKWCSRTIDSFDGGQVGY
jgi:hypothetical protein